MPIFRYKAFKPGGGGAAGTIEADGIKDASQKLKGLGLHPSEITEHDRVRRPHILRRPEKASLPALTRQLSVLLKSGVPLVDALAALSEESWGSMRGVLVRLKERVQAGASLSRAMEDFGGIFPDFYTSMVAAGQESGTLDEVMDSLADFLESQETTKEKVKAAMIYPVIMAAVGAVVLAFLFTFVIPKIVSIFEDTGAALPMATVVLIGVSNFFVYYWWLALGIVAALAFGIKRLKERHAHFIARTALKLPFHSLYYSRFARTLGVLLEGGLPMLRALEISSHATGNVWLQKKVKEAAVRVSEGARLSASLSGIPPILQQLLVTGERSGRLAEVLLKAAEAYEADFDRRIQRALALVEPAMILLMGLVVGFIVFAVLLPMFQLNQLIK